MNLSGSSYVLELCVELGPLLQVLEVLQDAVLLQLVADLLRTVEAVLFRVEGGNDQVLVVGVTQNVVQVDSDLDI